MSQYLLGRPCNLLALHSAEASSMAGVWPTGATRPPRPRDDSLSRSLSHDARRELPVRSSVGAAGGVMSEKTRDARADTRDARADTCDARADALVDT